MLRTLSLLLAVSSTAVLAQEVSAPPPSPEAPSPAAQLEPEQPLRPLSRDDRYRFRVPRGPIPAGFHLVEEPKWGLVAGGAIAFVLGTGVMVAIAIAARNPLYAIPLAGPFIGVAELMRGQDSLTAGLVFIYAGAAALIDVALQVAGIAMLVVGLRWPSRWLERDAESAPRVMLVPGVAGAPLGASLVGRF